ncbi:hypothetical protein ACU6QH_00575, partial [Aeromonas veronii]|uniref:hypothetical protein n=1 Tax=Aeromonas veronii TaxID=654 RepID=UPI00406C9D02
ASAPTDAQTVVTEAESTATPNPISTEGNAQQRPAGELEGKEVEKKPLSAREALLKASETVKNTEKEPDSAKDKDGKAKATAEADAKAL